MNMQSRPGLGPGRLWVWAAESRRPWSIVWLIVYAVVPAPVREPMIASSAIWSGTGGAGTWGSARMRSKAASMLRSVITGLGAGDGRHPECTDGVDVRAVELGVDDVEQGDSALWANMAMPRQPRTRCRVRRRWSRSPA